MKLLRALLVALLLLVHIYGLTQEQPSAPTLDTGTIDQQFEYVIRRSGNYQEYEVIRKTWINALRSHVGDSLQSLRLDVSEARNRVEGLRKEISSLEGQLASTKEDLTKVTAEKDQMSLIGVPLGKGTYRTVMWSIIGILVLSLVFFIYKYNNSNTITRSAVSKLEEVEQEFEDHRRRALGREQKVRRQLQDELNKNKKGTK